MKQSRKWVCWVGLVAGVFLCIDCWLSFYRLQSGWRFAWAMVGVAAVAGIAEFATRMFAPARMEAAMGRLNYRQRLALYWMHYLAVFGFFASAIAFLCLDFASAGHPARSFFRLLWIECMLLVACIGDLRGQSANVWRPLRPARLLDGENAVV